MASARLHLSLSARLLCGPSSLTSPVHLASRASLPPPSSFFTRGRMSTIDSENSAGQGRVVTTEAAAAGPAASSAAPASDVVVQYVVLRKDLWTEKAWPLGSVVAQACHAATAALWASREDPITASYCAPENIDHMHKVVLEIKNEEDLRKLSAKLTEAGIIHKLWIEQPEDYATSLAVKPYPKSVVAPHLKKLKLCKY